MIKYRQKDYTIQEGHYTGPKDMEKLPGVLELTGKGAVSGAIIGGLVGKIAKDEGHILDDAITGTKIGLLSGILFKLLTNYLHKPMTTIKFQEVDRNIRRQFGIYRIAGVTLGDNYDNRGKVEDNFSFNDRNVCDYKINIAIHNNQVTLYTFGISKEELDQLSKSLDYYCKKYFSMEYTAKLINQKVNAYSVDITFTNYQVLSNFIVEISKELKTKINLLDNNVIVTPRIIEQANRTEEDEKTFSDKSVRINKYELKKILSGGAIDGLTSAMAFGLHPANWIDVSILGALKSVIDTLSNNELLNLGVINISGSRSIFSNIYLVNRLRKLGFVEGFHYTDGLEKTPVNITLISGIFFLTVQAGSDEEKKIDKAKLGLYKSKSNKVILYSLALKNKKDFDYLLVKLMKLGLKPNIFQGPKKSGIKLFSNNMLTKIEDRIKSDGVEEYEIDDHVPSDCISITTSNLANIKIYIPEDYESIQYDLDDKLREINKFLRTTFQLERNILTMNIKGALTIPQVSKIIQFIIDETGFCTLLDM